MHLIEPHHGWRKYYISEADRKSPFYGQVYGSQYVNEVYGYYIHPDWDEIGSPTLYIKVLMADYKLHYCVVELIGELNDALHNDAMWLKRQLVDKLYKQGIHKYILIGENLFQFHGGDSDYYEEWYEDLDDHDGWIAAIGFKDFIQTELRRYRIDHYLHMGGTLDIDNWRTQHPNVLHQFVDAMVKRRLN
jgi:hypothetical protein